MPVLLATTIALTYAFHPLRGNLLLDLGGLSLSRNLRTGGPVYLRSGIIASLSASALKMSRLQKDQGPKEDAMGEYVGMQAIRNDLSRLESMTVKELRTMSRSVGISTRGTKKDLILALKHVAVDNEDATAGQCSLSAGNDISSAIKTIESQDMPSKRKAISPSSEDDAEDHSAFSEVSEKKQKRTRRKQQSATVIKGDSRTVVQQKKQSIEIEVSETQGSRLSERVSSRVKSTGKVVNQMKVESGEPWTMLVHKKPQDGWIPYNPKTMRPPPLSRDTKSVKLMSWNVNGLRALLKLESFSALQLAQKEDFDVLCLQETKIQEKDVEEIKERLIDGYDNSYWTCSVSKLGYSGTAIISRIKPVSVKYGLGVLDHDSEGRLVTAEFDTFYLLCGYVPNSGDGLRRLTYRVEEWDRSLSDYMKELEKSKPVILTGDLNCAHQEIDIFNPADSMSKPATHFPHVDLLKIEASSQNVGKKGNRRSAGFTDEERQSFERNFLSKGFVDTFRRQHPDVVGYTYWGYRHGGRKTNKGWRLDYFLASESIADTVHDSYILPEVTGSDHCPIGLILKL